MPNFFLIVKFLKHERKRKSEWQKKSQVSETVIENAMRITELVESGELPKSTIDDIKLGKTTQRKVLNAYHNVGNKHKPAHLREHKISLTLTAEQINLLLDFDGGCDTETHKQNLNYVYSLLISKLKQKFLKK